LKKLRVLVLFGGRSSEHEVSIRSATSVINALDVRKYHVIPAAISKEGHWLSPARSARLLRGVERELVTPGGRLVGTGRGSVLIRLDDPRSASVDVVFPVLHGPYGEDGTVQGMLELADVPYVGSGVAGSAVGMDKDLLKRVFRDAGLPVVDFLAIPRRGWKRNRKALLGEIRGRFTLPVFVKPACLGSSVGISKVKSLERLGAAIDFASRFDTKILVEEGIDARELECSVLGNDRPAASCVGEIIPGGEFYDYDEKYIYDRTRLIIPAELPRRTSEKVRDFSVRAFRAADCSGLARVDFLMDRSTLTLYVSELNTMPGFTSISMYPKLWEHSGVSYPKLLDRLIALALERHADRSNIRVDR
jgi:D-alanine-D-alanine ligase